MSPDRAVGRRTERMSRSPDSQYRPATVTYSSAFSTERDGNDRERELTVGPRVADLGAEVLVDAYEGEALHARDLARLGEGFAGADRSAELAIDRSGDEVRMRVHLDPRCDA